MYILTDFFIQIDAPLQKKNKKKNQETTTHLLECTRLLNSQHPFIIFCVLLAKGHRPLQGQSKVRRKTPWEGTSQELRVPQNSHSLTDWGTAPPCLQTAGGDSAGNRVHPQPQMWQVMNQVQDPSSKSSREQQQET